MQHNSKIISHHKKGIALILTLGIIFMLGIIVGSFAFFTSTANKNTKTYASVVNATNFADAGYQYMLGAIHDYFERILSTIQKEAGPLENGEPYKISSERFNKIQSTLAAYLEGKPVDFTSAEWTWLNDEVSSEVQEKLNDILFEDGNESLGYPESWNKKFKLGRNTDDSGGLKSFDVDLDGINNYDYSLTGLSEWDYAQSILQFTDPTSTATVAPPARQFSEDNVDKEIRDANWHEFRDEGENLIGRFAVMAKDQSSLVNLQTDLGEDALGEITNQIGGITRQEIDAAALTSPEFGVENLITQFSDNAQASGLKEMYTTSSVNAAKTIDLNSSELTDFFVYLNEDSLTSGTPTKEKMAANAKIAVNLEDFTDSDAIPSVLTQYSWSADELTKINPWSALSESDIFFGIEGVRISEVMVQPEQAYTFGRTNTPLRFTLSAGNVAASDEYFYTTSFSQNPTNSMIAEILEENGFDIKVSPDFSFSFAEENDSAVLQLSSFKNPDDTHESFRIRNPGGPYQIWLKMKITAKNPAMDDDALTNLTTLSTKTEPDAVVLWSSPSPSATPQQIKDSSIVTFLRADLVATLDSTQLDLYNTQALTLSAAETIFPTEFSSATFLITANPGSTLSQIMIDGPIDEPKQRMNFPKNDSDQRPVVTLNWGDEKGILTSNEDVLAYLNTKLNAATDNLYPFGSRVVEVSLFDEVETAAGGTRDELIGVFYCVNTNGFAEDDTAIANSEWPVVDNDYLWFYSIGVPEWTTPDEMPSWIKLMTDEGEWVPLGPGALESEKYNYNKNLCVFPRSDCNLKMRFRLVNLQDSRFNGGETPNYGLGIDSLTMDGQDINQTSDLTTIPKLQRNLSIVGRPQWNNGDTAEIEIKEMVITQQVYDTGLKKATFIDNNNPQNNKYIANTYQYIEPGNPQLLQLMELPPMASNPGKREPSLNKTIYFRNQRLENRAANENHQAEYIEIYNGNSKPVDMDGWVLKIEQYKLIDGEYELLGPAKPNSYIDRTYDLDLEDEDKGDLLSYSSRVSTATGMPDYIYIHNTTIPGNSLKSNKKALPFAVIANGLNYASLDPRGELIAASKPRTYFNNQFTEPLSFENAYNIALGQSSFIGVEPSYTDLAGKLYLTSSDTLPEVRTESGNVFSYHVKTPTGVTVPGSTQCPLRKSPTSSSNTVNWYSVNSSGAENYQYETFNLVSGIVFKKESTSSYCDSLKVDYPSRTFHDRNYYKLYISGSAINWTDSNFSGLNILGIFRSTAKSQNPFGELTTTFPALEKLFAPEKKKWDELWDIANSETDSYAFAKDHSDDYKTLMLPFITSEDKTNLPENLAVEAGQWKYDAITALDSSDTGGLKAKVKLMNAIWEHATLVVEFAIDNAPAFPSYNSAPDYVNGYDTSSTGKDSAYIQNENAHYGTRADLLFPWRFPDSNKEKPNGVGSVPDLLTLFQEYVAGITPFDYSVSSTAKTNLIYPNILGETEFNFTPNNFDFPIISDTNTRTVATSSDIIKRAWAFIPVRFHAARPKDTEDVQLNQDTFNINLNAAWNYISTEEVTYATTVNLSRELPTSEDFNVTASSIAVLSSNSGLFFNNIQGVNPLHFRDDADRIVISLFAPNGVNRINISNLNDAKDIIYTDANGTRTYGETQKASFGLIEEEEWLSGDRSSYTSGEVVLDPEFYSLIDRAVIDRTELNKNFRLENTSAPDIARFDWRGNKAVRLKTFFTNPHLLRQGSPGSISNLTPFQEEADETLAIKCSGYWETHPPVFKTKPGPIGEKLQFVLEAYGSPGMYNFRHNQIDKSIQSLVAPVEPYFLELDKSAITPTTLNGETPAEREMRSLSITSSYTDNVLNSLTTYNFYDYLRTGFSNFDHRVLPYPENGFFIKNGPLTSISELCDVPAPNIENATIGQDPLTPDSLVNGFVDGEETALQYFSEEQKRKVFSGTSTDGTLLSPGNSTEITFNLDPVKAYSGEALSSNPISFNYDTGNARAIRLQYTFLCTGDKRHFNPGRYKILMSGIDPTWDVFSLVTIVSDVRNSAISNDSGLIQRAGGALIELDDPALQDITKNESIQIISSGGEEFFNVQERIEINFFIDPGSTVLATNYADNVISKTATTDITLLEAITQSVSFGAIKFFLVPQGSTGKVNINTAPLQTLLRLPGFMHAIDRKSETDSHQRMKQNAAREILIDILETRDPANGGRAFTDAGDLLVSGTPGVLSTSHRIFPVNGKQVENTLTDPNGLRDDDLLKELMAREKLRIFREALPYIQFAGHSFEIVSLGQSMKSIANTNRILSSSKVTATVNLKNLLKDLSKKYVQDFWDVAEEVEVVGDDEVDEISTGG